MLRLWKITMNAYITRKKYDRVHTTKKLRVLTTLLQHARAQAIQDAYRRAEASHPRENAPKAGSIRSLGLIGKEEETKAVLAAK